MEEVLRLVPRQEAVLQTEKFQATTVFLHFSISIESREVETIISILLVHCNCCYYFVVLCLECIALLFLASVLSFVADSFEGFNDVSSDRIISHTVSNWF